MSFSIPPFASVSEFIQILTNRKLDYANSFVTDPPAVSIISPFYNDYEYFEFTYQSIINQTWQNYEWIIIDDCSTDLNSVELFNSLRQRNPKIQTFRQQKNQGPAKARNTGVSHAKGKYLFFMDTDDLIEPTYIEKSVLFLETHPEFSLVNSYSVGFQAEEYWWNQGFNTPSRFVTENLVTGRLLYKKSDFEQLGGYDESLRYGEDWELWLKSITNHQKAYTIPEYLDCYRRTDSGLLGIARRENNQRVQKIQELIKVRYQEFFKNNDLPDIYLERPSFNVHQLRSKISIKNQLYISNNGKRILCFLPHLKLGGSDKFNLDLFTGLKQKGYDLTLVTTLPAENDWYAKFYEITPDIFNLTNLFHYGHWLTFTRYIIESRQIDIVFISNAYYAYYLLPLIKQEFPQVAFVDYTHTDDPDWREGGYPRVSCQFSDFLDLQIVTSQHLANHYQTVKYDTKDKLKVCYINVDTEKWQQNQQQGHNLRQKLGISQNKVVLLFPARITGQKRPLFLVDIISKLVEKNLPIAVITLGRGDLFDLMQEKVKQLELDSCVHLLPSVSPEEMISYYSAADILLLPSAYEGISLSVYEAMSMQLPIVASEVGGQRELVTSKTGFLISKGEGDSAELARYIEILVPLIQDEKMREQIGKLARKRVGKVFSLPLMIEHIEAIFAEAMELSRNREKTINNSISTVYEEMLIWIQEYLALDKLWNNSQILSRQIEDMNTWSHCLKKENQMFNHQNEAWKKVAQKNQIELEKSQVQLLQAQAKIQWLQSQLKQSELSKNKDSIIQSN